MFAPNSPLATPVGVTVGGVGVTTMTANNVLLGNGNNAIQFVAPGANGNVLTSNGTTWQSSAPTGGGGTTQAVAINFPSQFVPHNVETLLGFTAANLAFDPTSMAAGSSSRIVIGATGYYQLNLVVHYSTPTGSAIAAQIVTAVRNGTLSSSPGLVSCWQQTTGITIAEQVRYNVCSRLLLLNPSNVLTLWSYQSTGVTATVQNTYTGPVSYFSLHRVG